MKESNQLLLKPKMTVFRHRKKENHILSSTETLKQRKNGT